MRGGFVILAALVHAAVFALVPSARSPRDAPSPVETADVEISLDDGAEGGRRAEGPSAAPAEAANGAVAMIERAETHEPSRRDPDATGSPVPESPVPPVATIEPPPASPASSSRPFSLAELGVAGSKGMVGSSRFLGGGTTYAPDATPRPPGPPADSSAPPSAAELSRRAERSITEPLARREQSLGLGPDGPVLVALRDATYSGMTSVNGRAVLRATADGNGVVTSVEVLDASVDRAAWEAIAAEAIRALRRKPPLRLSKRSRGVSMRIEVISHVQLPSGLDPGSDVSVLGIPLKKSGNPNSSKIDILNPKTGAIIGVVGDLADIGANPRRLVTAHVVDEATL